LTDGTWKLWSLSNGNLNWNQVGKRFEAESGDDFGGNYIVEKIKTARKVSSFELFEKKIDVLRINGE
jgi:hypothetical protein